MIVLECSETYQTIVTTISLFRPAEKTHENLGVPWRAFAGSIALHVLFLGSFVGVPDTEPAGVAPSEPLRAALRSEPDPEPARQSVLPAPVAAAAAASPGGGVRASAISERPELANVALAPIHPLSGPDAAGLRQYRLALAGEARRFRSYPEAARRDGLAGTAEVRISVSAGIARQTELARSSGHAVLDSSALEMLRAAAASALLPESLRGQEFAVLLPVVFEVDD